MYDNQFPCHWVEFLSLVTTQLNSTLTLSLPSPSSMILGKYLTHFPHLNIWHSNSTCLVGLLRKLVRTPVDVTIFWLEHVLVTFLPCALCGWCRCQYSWKEHSRIHVNTASSKGYFSPWSLVFFSSSAFHFLHSPVTPFSRKGIRIHMWTLWLPCWNCKI